MCAEYKVWGNGSELGRVREKGEVEGRREGQGESRLCGSGAVGRGSRGIFKMFVLIVGEGDTRPYAFVKPIEPYKE